MNDSMAPTRIQAVFILIILIGYSNLTYADCIYLKSGKVECFKIIEDKGDRYIIREFNTRSNRYEQKEIFKSEVLVFKADTLKIISIETKEDSLRLDKILRYNQEIERPFTFEQFMWIATIAALMAIFL